MEKQMEPFTKSFLKQWRTDLENRLKQVTSEKEKSDLLIQENRELMEEHLSASEQRPSRPEMDSFGEMKYQYASYLRSKRSEILEELGLNKMVDKFYKKHDPSLGSAPTHMPLTFYHCANNEESVCTKEGKFRCSGCFLVAYCSQDCQRKHWKIHRDDCILKNQTADCISSIDWQPDWILKKRSPNFLLTDSELMEKCDLWGTTPAVDIINWNNNEVEKIHETTEYKEPITLMFAESGDFRNLIETLASVPPNVKSPIHIILNDKSPLVSARNFIMLLLMQYYSRDAIDGVLHFWYSCMLTDEQHLQIGRGLGESATNKLEVDNSTVFEKDLFKIVLHNRKVILDTVMLKMIMLNFYDVNEMIDTRLSVMSNSRTDDNRQSFLKNLKPPHRAAFRRFVSLGLFTPFGGYFLQLNTPNKFILNPETHNWLIPEDISPIDGWQMDKVVAFAKENKLPPNDLFGCLFYYIRDRLWKAIKVLETVPVEVEIYSEAPRNLVKIMKNKKITFDRIDVSNLCGDNKEGIQKVLQNWIPLLNKKNSCASLITLFTNWHSDAKPTEKDFDKISETFGSEIALKAREVMLHNNSSMVRALLDDSDEFGKYLQSKIACGTFGAVKRMQNKIVPHRLYAPINAPENYTLKDDELYYGACVFRCSLRERYVE